ncbi:glutamate synthase (NADPH), homotetrameric [Methanocella sp. CWC-04]|uniref:Glutamate synthase (NADPH), homotetrameric n=1 Tax=Methanooceanicella nereidis TaxID=2052831 RepID=A0AAP2REZ6_9EURY|nr:NADPH-dependent glutamate synthase [Methanocella sp. CWC-04]MCD1294992.1 glutamate synthase (NADPH), homotetrameric [Methanocella sp. CWC-04]
MPADEVIDRRKHVPVREQEPSERVGNFDEVSYGYNEEEAMKEAKRCLNCKTPLCIDGCPVGVDIPKFVTEIAKGEFDEAIKTIKDKNNLPAICGRVCPQESQCEKLCTLGMKWKPLFIGKLERFAADHEKSDVKPELPEWNGKKVAVVGSGPAGLTAAADLAKMGYKVVIFEALHTPGGVLIYGIPEFRLPKSIVEKEVEYVKSLGVEIRLNEIVGRTITIDEMFGQGFSAVFIGSGAGLPSFMRIPGENLNGVYSANEYLTRVNLMKAYQFPEFDTPVKKSKNIAVIGGGNVAMDAARTAKRMGADHVYLIYRRGEEEMPARREETEHAKEEGIEFKLLMNPTRIIGDDNGWVKGIECIHMRLCEPDESGRCRPEPVQGSEEILDVDTVVVAIGTSPNPLIVKTTPGLETSKDGTLVVDGYTFMTSREGVFAGGDIVSGAATVISAMGQAKEAAVAIDEYIKSKE